MPLVWLLLSAAVIDAVAGDPVYRFHPVRLIGLLIGFCERLLMRLGLKGRAGGVLLLFAVAVISVAFYIAVRLCLSMLHSWVAVVWDVFMLFSCVALRDMVAHAMPIGAALRDNDLTLARKRVQGIVGRDAALLDESGVARATVESVSESFVDGFFAPLFWALVAGLVAGSLGGSRVAFAVGGALLYRVVNTLDSMVGYRNGKYIRFGTASARFDDLLNFIPARLSLLVLFPAALICGVDALGGWRVAMRDRLKHASPNSAHTESFVAGALQLRLGGPTEYAHGVVDKPWLGDGRDSVGSADIVSACRLMMVSGWLWVILLSLAGGLIK